MKAEKIKKKTGGAQNNYPSKYPWDEIEQDYIMAPSTVTVKDLCKKWGFHEDTFYERAKAGKWGEKRTEYMRVKNLFQQQMMLETAKGEAIDYVKSSALLRKEINRLIEIGGPPDEGEDEDDRPARLDAQGVSQVAAALQKSLQTMAAAATIAAGGIPGTGIIQAEVIPATPQDQREQIDDIQKLIEGGKGA